MENTQYQKPSKFIKINLNLKNEIFEFIPLKMILTEVISTNKSFKKASGRRFPEELRKNFDLLRQEINFTLDCSKAMKKYFVDLGVDENFTNEIYLFFLLENYKTSSELRFHQYKIELDLEIFALFIASHKGLTYLEFEEILAHKFFRVFSAIEINRNVKQLQIRYVYANKFDWPCRCLINTSVQEIDLLYNKLGDEGAKAIAETLRTNTSLRKIALNHNRIGAEGARAIAETLRTNTSLQKINLSVNRIGDEGVKAFAEALKINTSLKRIGLNHNKIGAEGAEAFAEAIRINTSLQKIHLSENQIRNEGAKFIIEALKTNTSLQIIHLKFNQIREEKMNEINIDERIILQ